MEQIEKMQIIGDINYKLDVIIDTIDNFNSNLISQIPNRQNEIHKLAQDVKDLISKISKELFNSKEGKSEMTYGELYDKAFELIILKNVDVNEIRPNATAKDYNSKIPYYRRPLTDEEFKFLKERWFIDWIVKK